MVSKVNSTVELANSLCCLALLVLSPCTATAQRDWQHKVVDAYIDPLLKGRPQRAIVVGVVDSSRRYIRSYGSTSPYSFSPPDSSTIFEIGSLTKVFTGLLLADMAEREEVMLNDPIHKYLPATVDVPRLPDAPITLLDLATHTSGLPRLPPNLKRWFNYHNPYARYTTEDLYTFLTSYRPQPLSRGAYLYSNLGMGLLGHLLALRGGASYDRLVVERIAEPLGLRDTRTMLDSDEQERFVSGYNFASFHTAAWTSSTLAGAGMLRSNVDDLLRFLEAYLRLRDKARVETYPIEQALRLSITPMRSINETTEDSIALGWHVRPSKAAKGTIFWHNGMTGGYSSFLAFNPDVGLGLVVLANAADLDLTSTAMQLLERLATITVQEDQTQREPQQNQVLLEAPRLDPFKPTLQLRFNRVEGAHLGLALHALPANRLAVSVRGGYDTGLRRLSYGLAAQLGLGSPITTSFPRIRVGYGREVEPRYSSRYYRRDLAFLVDLISNPTPVNVINHFPAIMAGNTSLSSLFGSSDYFDYFENERFGVSAAYHACFLKTTVEVSLNMETHRSVNQTTGAGFVAAEPLKRPNPEIEAGRFRAIGLQVTLNDRHLPLGEFGGRQFSFNLEHAFPGLLGGDFDFTRIEALLDWRVLTFQRKQRFPQTLDVRLLGGLVLRGELPLQRFGVVEGNLSASLGSPTPFGVLKTRFEQPYEGVEHVGIFWEYNFRGLPLKTLGLHGLTERGMEVLLTGGHGRTWISDTRRATLAYEPDLMQRFHHEIGVSINGILGYFRMDFAARLDARSFNVGLSHVKPY